MKLKPASAAADGISIGDTIRRALAAAGLGTTVTPPLADNDRGPRPSARSVPGEFVERSYSNAAGVRRYKLYVPKNCPEGRRPLLVMLHGCTQNPDDFAAGTRMNELAEQHGFLVAYPAQAANANVSQCWNWFNAGDQVRDLGEPSLLAGITREVASSYCVDTQRIFVAGLSAGAAMAVILGATYPDLFAAVGAHSGLPYGAAADMPSAFAAMRGGSGGGIWGAGLKSPSSSTRVGSTRGPSTIVFHGDHDTTVHADNGDRIVAEALTRTGVQTAGLKRSVQRQSSAGGRQSTITTYRDAALRPRVEYWVVHGAGHAWSGGSPAGSFIDASGPDASAEMARFFLAQA
ncbi:MAG: PHB depolymerase family esterase [Pseudomonadota bacterium]|nr:PHB depolymerase family esterase [Pseudomonadota bacterium]